MVRKSFLGNEETQKDDSLCHTNEREDTQKDDSLPSIMPSKKVTNCKRASVSTSDSFSLSLSWDLSHALHAGELRHTVWCSRCLKPLTYKLLFLPWIHESLRGAFCYSICTSKIDDGKQVLLQHSLEFLEIRKSNLI